MRLGVLGGTFDPVHFGHLLAAEEARMTLRLERVLFAPAALPPHKLQSPLLPVQHRLAMVRLAIADNPAFALSTVDVHRPGPHYTVDTMHLIREELGIHAENTFLIMGTDSLIQLATWHEPTRLIQMCRLAVVARPNYQVDFAALETTLPGLSSRLDWVTMPVLGISSTDLQRRVRAGRSIRYQTPASVARYIVERRLYLSI
jgi:nicotinate-nucleotide adenylyltransferase